MQRLPPTALSLPRKGESWSLAGCSWLQSPTLPYNLDIMRTTSMDRGLFIGGLGKGPKQLVGYYARQAAFRVDPFSRCVRRSLTRRSNLVVDRPAPLWYYGFAKI